MDGPTWAGEGILMYGLLIYFIVLLPRDLEIGIKWNFILDSPRDVDSDFAFVFGFSFLGGQS